MAQRPGELSGILIWITAATVGSTGAAMTAGLPWTSGATVGALIGVTTTLGWHALQFARYRRWNRAPLRRPVGLYGRWAQLAEWQTHNQQRARRRSRLLRAGLRRFRAATASLPDAAVLIRPDATIDWINPAATVLLGLHAHDVGRPLTDRLGHPHIVELLSRGSESGFMEIESPVRDKVFLELRLVEADDHRRLLLVRDTTRIQRLTTIRQDFIANVSHELRTPLTVIVGYLETLDEARGTIDPATLQALLTRLAPPAHRMRALVNDLLLLSRLDSSDQPPSEELSTFEIGPMLQALVDEARQLCTDHHQVCLSLDGPRQFRGVEQEIHSAFNNLITNAVRYSPDGGRIGIHWGWDLRDPSAAPTGARFSVTDEGLGIPDGHLERLTERFYRVDVGRSRGTGGTGLGLAIVKHVLRRHGSELEITSTVGEGSKFSCGFGPRWIPDQSSAVAVPPRTVAVDR